MEVIVVEEPGQGTRLAAAMVARQVARKADSVLGLATGRTMVAVYQQLVHLHQQGLDFSRVRSFNLDEYVGLPPEHPCSYHSYMRENLLDRVNLSAGAARLPDGMAADVEGHCRDYEQAIQACGGIDLQLLGLGADGHIGFNEPSSSLASRMRIKTLAPMTVRANRAEFPPGESPPIHVLTLGVANILEARHCLLLAFGDGKAEAVAAMVEGPITAMCPASALQQHPRCTVIVDETAAERLRLRDYFRFVYANKPDWQRLE